MAPDNYTSEEVECGRCTETELVYTVKTEKGPVNRCLPCLAVERGHEKLRLPFETFIDQETGEMMGELGIADRRKEQYETARDWFLILNRLRRDDPLLRSERDDSDSHEVRHVDSFLKEVMGEAAYYAPSDIIDSDGDPAQQTLHEI